MKDKILIIEDSRVSILLLQEYLQEFGYDNVFMAKNGKEGLQLAESLIPDIILLDIFMPNMNGYEVCQHLKNNKRIKDIPVIFLSALSEPFDKVKAFEIGGIDYVTKPFEEQELNARINTHLKLSKLNNALKEKNEEYVALNEEYKNQNKELIKAKEKAEENEEKTRKILNAFDAPIYLNTPDFKITYMNRAMENKIGKDKIGTKCYKSIYNFDKKCKWCKFYDLLQSGKLIAYDMKTPGKEQYLHVRNILLANNQKLSIYHDITERVEAEKKIFNAIITAEEKERTHFASELHDGLGPLMSTLKIFMQAIGKVEDPNKIKEFAQKSQTVFNEIMQTITEVSNNLSPHILHKFGLYTGLKTFIEKNAKYTGINFVFDFNHKQFENTICKKTNKNCKLSNRMDEIHEITIYRIITELINNSIKHSKATEIKIKFDKHDHSLYIKYSDNGIGFDIDTVLNHNLGLGLQNIQNRIKNINGTVKFITFTNKGFSANIVIDCYYKAYISHPC